LKTVIRQKFFYPIFIPILVILYYSVFLNIGEYSNTSYFGGDEYGYQSMGVNFTYGHGIQKLGGLEEFETYKFAPREDISGELLEFPDMNIDFFYRTPAYPMFLGVIYKVFGVEPIIAKHIQLLLLVLIAAFLPLVGQFYWNLHGFYNGMIAGPIYLIMNYKFSENLLTESLISFSIFLVVLAYIYFEMKNKSSRATIILGLACGTCLLVKGSLVFLPILISGYFGYLFYKNRDRVIIRRIALFLTAFALTVLPWSVYASVKSGELILISTQGKAVFMDTNNEYADGRWRPQWKRDPNSFYMNDGMQESSAIFRVANFYLHNPGTLPVLLWKKFVQGYGYLLTTWILLLVLFLDSVRVLLKKALTANLIRWLFSLIMVLMTGIIVYYWKTYLMADVLHFYTILSSTTAIRWFQLLLIALAIVVPTYLSRNGRMHVKAPEIFVLLFFNFLIVTLLTCADHTIYPSRYVKVMDFVLILFTVHYISSFTVTMVKLPRMQRMNENP